MWIGPFLFQKAMYSENSKPMSTLSTVQFFLLHCSIRFAATEKLDMINLVNAGAKFYVPEFTQTKYSDVDTTTPAFTWQVKTINLSMNGRIAVTR